MSRKYYYPSLSEPSQDLVCRVDEHVLDILGIDPSFRNDAYKKWSIDKIMMSVAYLVAKGSHDSDTQHGSCIVDKKNHIVSTGCNGFLPGSPDDILPNTRKDGHKYKFVIHSERNACDQATRADLSDCRIYVTGVPCNECMKSIINKGIRNVIIGDIGHVFEDGFWEMHEYLISAHSVSVRAYSGEIIDLSAVKKIGLNYPAIMDQALMKKRLDK